MPWQPPVCAAVDNSGPQIYSSLPMTRPRWTGRLWLGTGRALYVGPVFDTTEHAHHALQLCIALEGPLALGGARRAGPDPYEAALVPADHPHRIRAAGSIVALLYVEPESAAGRHLVSLLDGPEILDLGERAGHLRAAIARPTSAHEVPESEARADALLKALVGPTPKPPVLDPRVDESLCVLHSARGDYPTSAALARRFRCSPERFRHLFRAQTGIGYRSYLLWLRLGAAAGEISRGPSMTEAAHAAGFADSAHLTRTFRRMFGIAPSQAPPFAV